MHIPRVVAAVLAARQLGTLLPSDYCTPECPSCKEGVSNFDNTTDCVPSSSFLTNCGACQTCIQTYAIEYPATPDVELLQADVGNIIDLCEDSPASDEVQALQSQASRISDLGSRLATVTATPTTNSHGITAAPTATMTGTRTRTGTHSWSTEDWDSESWTSILATATWASRYLSRISAESVASAAAASVVSEYGGHNLTANITPAPMTTSPISSVSAGSTQPLDRSWIIGPVIGSILGLATVFVVVFFTRRKQRMDAGAAETPVKQLEDDDSNHSDEGKPQLHSESVAAQEMENTEVIPPVELPALEPVGSELNTPKDGSMVPIEEWPLPLSPLTLLFAMTELRDERTGWSDSLKHETFYHP